MPCRNDPVVVHSFPVNFETDTDYVSQALAAHNADRVLDGLPVAHFAGLSAAEQHDVLLRAQHIKAAARYSPIQMAPITPATKPYSQTRQSSFFTPGAILLALGIVGMVAMLWKILG